MRRLKANLFGMSRGWCYILVNEKSSTSQAYLLKQVTIER